MVNDACDVASAAATAGPGANQADMASLERFLCILGVTCAHELVHCFFGFLAGWSQWNTPRTVRAGLSRGELGCFWEKAWCAHWIEAYWDPQDHRGNRQAGGVVANDAFRTGYYIPRAWIQALVNFSKSSRRS